MKMYVLEPHTTGKREITKKKYFNIKDSVFHAFEREL